MVVTLILTIFAGAFCLYYFFHRNYNSLRRSGVPGPNSFPLFGSLIRVIFRQSSFPEQVQSLYNFDSTAKYVGLYVFSKPIIMLRDPELVKSIAIKNFDSFPDHVPFADASQDPLFGKNLFSLRGDQWRDMRALLSPSFTSSKMKMMFKLISHCATDFADFLSTTSTESNVLEMKDAFARYTNDVIATSAFGITVNSMRDRNNEFYVMGKDATNFEGIRSLKFFLIGTFPRLSRWLDVKLISDKTTKFFYDVIRTTINTRDAEGIMRPDMIQLMMQSRKEDSKVNLTIESMTAQAFIFFFAGFDTSSTMLSFCSYLLAVHQDVQEKLLTEIRAVLEQCEGEVTYEALHGMKYLDAVINETLRMYPPVPALDRLCVKSFDLPPAKPGLKPYTVKVGDLIWIPAYGFHYDPEYYPEPDRFNPDRFIGDGKNDVNPLTYLPFGVGPRACIGNRFASMEAKLVLFHLLNRCHLKPCAKTVIPMKLTKSSFNMAPESGMWLAVEPRV